MSERDRSNGRLRREGRDVFGAKNAKDGNFRAIAADGEKRSMTTPAPGVLQDIASALGGMDRVASWLYWERRGSASWSPLDGASEEQRAVVLKALERVEKARRKPHPR